MVCALSPRATSMSPTGSVFLLLMTVDVKQAVLSHTCTQQTHHIYCKLLIYQTHAAEVLLKVPEKQGIKKTPNPSSKRSVSASSSAQFLT